MRLFLLLCIATFTSSLHPTVRPSRRAFINSGFTAALAFQAKPALALNKLVDEKLAIVPVFCVTTEDGEQPYFSETDYATGAPVALFYLEKQFARPTLAKVLKSDGAAKITSVPMSTALEFVMARDKKSQDENGGIFRFEASRRQIVHANGNSGRDLQLDKKGIATAGANVPLFFDRRVSVTSSDAFPFFFKLEDLENTFSKGTKGLPDEIQQQVKLNVEVTTLDRAVSGLLDGSLDERILFLSSETF